MQEVEVEDNHREEERHSSGMYNEAVVVDEDEVEEYLSATGVMVGGTLLLTVP